MIRKLILPFLLFTCSLTARAQNPYEFQIKGVSDTTVYLANYYGEKLYYADTAKADSEGRITFKRIPSEKEGKYAVVIPGPKYFEIIVADGENIKMKTDTADLVENMVVLESQNNKVMYDYMHYLIQRRAEREKLLADLEENEGKPEITAGIKAEYNELNDRVVAYQKNIAETHPDLFIAKEIKMALEPEPPAEIRDDKQASYFYYKRHYFDHIDLNDERIVRTPVFHGRLDNYLKNTLLQNPDTVISAMDQLIGKIEPGTEVFKYVVHYATYSFETSKVMGMDKAFVHMVDTYYTDDLAFWMDEEKLETIREKADQKRNTLIGLKAPELILADTAGNWISTLKGYSQDYIILYFYDPDCGHCKRDTPKLVDFYNESDKSKVAIYAVSSETGKKWKDFIRKNEMTFTNVAIPQKAYDDSNYATGLVISKKTNLQSLKYQETFDVFSTPKLILLDKNREIIAKDIGVEQLSELIERFEQPKSEEEVSEEN